MKRRSGFGWLELIIGIVLIALGILTLVEPAYALSGMIFAYGIVAVIIGIADILLYIRVERYTGFGPTLSLITGALSVMFGIALIVYPGTGVGLLTVLFPIWFIAHCISRLMHLNHIRFVAGNAIFYCTLVINVIGLILGALMLFSPLLSLAAITAYAGAYLILLGIDSLLMAFSGVGERY